MCFVIVSVASESVNGQDDLRRRGRGRQIPFENVFEDADAFDAAENDDAGNTEVEDEEDIFSSFGFQDRLRGFKPLSEVEVPLPRNLYDFIRDREAALILGKALFWDMQAGSDFPSRIAAFLFATNLSRSGGSGTGTESSGPTAVGSVAFAGCSATEPASPDAITTAVPAAIPRSCPANPFNLSIID